MGEPASQLIDALTEVRTVVAGARFPLALPSAPTATTTAARLNRQVDDYLLPRLDRLDAPLLVVVGGSTGAGKSTLVNSLVRAPVSDAGVLRPTTRAPILVSHPHDAAWFGERRILPGLARSHANRMDRGTMQVISAPELTAGLALLDAPDIDSVVDENRELAERLLAAADVWLFVTTAARYADAVGWQVLRSARDRGTVLAMVLDRVPPGAEVEITAHLREMLAARDLGGVDVFAIPEVPRDGSGLLAEPLVTPLHDYLSALAGDAVARSGVIRTTLGGAIRSLIRDVDGLANAADEQAAA
ncbi:MAG TPA: ABC transporter, partial [Micromonosporaceae bacterium]